MSTSKEDAAPCPPSSLLTSSCALCRPKVYYDSVTQHCDCVVDSVIHHRGFGRSFTRFPNRQCHLPPVSKLPSPLFSQTLNPLTYVPSLPINLCLSLVSKYIEKRGWGLSVGLEHGIRVIKTSCLADHLHRSLHCHRGRGVAAVS